MARAFGIGPAPGPGHPGGGRVVPSVTSIHFSHHDAEWQEDSSVSDDSYAGARTLVRAPSVEELRHLDEGSRFGRADEDRASALARSLYPVAAHGDAAGRPAHWATAEEVPLEVAEGRATAMEGARARADAPPRGAGAGSGSGSVASEGDVSATSSQLWDRLEDGGARHGVESSRAEIEERPARTRRGSSFAGRGARVAAGLLALAALAGSAGYLVSGGDGGDRPWLGFLLENNFLGRVRGRDGGARVLRRGPATQTADLVPPSAGGPRGGGEGRPGKMLGS